MLLYNVRIGSNHGAKTRTELRDEDPNLWCVRNHIILYPVYTLYPWYTPYVHLPMYTALYMYIPLSLSLNTVYTPYMCALKVPRGPLL